MIGFLVLFILFAGAAYFVVWLAHPAFQNRRCRQSLIGLHHPVNRPEGFVRHCDNCGAEWVADYFEWRARGYPTWIQIKRGKFSK